MIFYSKLKTVHNQNPTIRTQNLTVHTFLENETQNSHYFEISEVVF